MINITYIITVCEILDQIQYFSIYCMFVDVLLIVSHSTKRDILVLPKYFVVNI